MKVQYVSDIHLEFRKSYEIQRIHDARVLVLAGDICTYKTIWKLDRFLDCVVSAFNNVVYVPGNHEYYGNVPMSNVDHALESICQSRGVHFLNNSSVDLEGVSFLGTTLWFESMRWSDNLADFDQIQFEHRYAKCTEFLVTELAKPGQKLVVTHHLPSYECIAPEHIGHPLNEFFASSTIETLKLDGNCVPWWICGHSHGRWDVSVQGIRVVRNAIGYPGERINANVNTSLEYNQL